jgi:hypothetical protein
MRDVWILAFLAALALAVAVWGVLAASAHGSVPPPLPESEWTASARLTLARSLVAEAGWRGARTGEHAAISYVYVRRWRAIRKTRPSVSFEQVIRAYSAPFRAEEPTPRQRWVLGLPESLAGRLARYRPAFDRVLATMDRWSEGRAWNPCPGALHFGAPTDTPAQGLRRVRCSERRGEIGNWFWRRGPRVIPARVARGR